MAKKTNKQEQWEENADDAEYAAYCLTLLLKAVAPHIDKAETYELVLQLVDEGLTEESAEPFGLAIRATGNPGGNNEVH